MTILVFEDLGSYVMDLVVIDDDLAVELQMDCEVYLVLEESSVSVDLVVSLDAVAGLGESWDVDQELVNIYHLLERTGGNLETCWENHVVGRS